ncbi:MAG: hypothetical protein QHI38_13665 [Armatimonadota bacterium]|nr:hypothetical protein [Armatimonadota bacterium]
MRKHYLLAVCLALALTASAQATINPPSLYMDTAPNVYGSPNWGTWWTNAKEDVANGLFQNMGSGQHPGTNYFTALEEIVYSTGDLGKRLHWIYWVPGASISNLTNNFQVKWVIDWEGENYTYDWDNYDLVLDEPEKGWIQPGSWANYEGGVIGTFGFAWWATDDEAPPYDTNNNPYDETDQADILALAKQIEAYQTFARGCIRWRDGENSPWQYKCLEGRVYVPEPCTVLLGILGLGTAAGLRRLKK